MGAGGPSTGAAWRQQSSEELLERPSHGDLDGALSRESRSHRPLPGVRMCLAANQWGQVSRTESLHHPCYRSTRRLEGYIVKKLAAMAFVVGALLLGSAGSAFADHLAGPCDDSDGDGAPSGREYAEHHIVSFAHAGLLGHVHKPGDHNGFSACDPSSL
jgi:hypothetical protein